MCVAILKDPLALFKKHESKLYSKAGEHNLEETFGIYII